MQQEKDHMIYLTTLSMYCNVLIKLRFLLKNIHVYANQCLLPV